MGTSGKKPLVIGHRGMGASFNQFAFCQENTIESFNKAKYLHHADYIEFDVQLTADLVPVIFHDFHICVPVVTADSKGPKWEKRPLNQFTLEELSCLEIHHKSVMEDTEKKDNKTSVRRDVQSFKTSPFPTLKEVFEHTDPSLAFDIEIKFPMKLKCGEWECEEQPLSHAEYIKEILKVVKDDSYSGRQLLFSSFNPDICLELKMQQSQFDVVFLTQGLTQIYPPYEDLRTVGSEAAIRFAAAQNLAGVAFHSEELETRWEILMQLARSHKLKTYVWGRSLNSQEAVEFFSNKVGADGLCYDISVVYREEVQKCLTASSAH